MSHVSVGFTKDNPNQRQKKSVKYFQKTTIK